MASRSLGTLTLDVVAKIGGFTGPLDKAARDLDTKTRAMQKRVDDFSKSLKVIGAGIAGFVSGAAVAGFAGLVAGINKTIDSMDDLSKSAQKVGVTTEELSKLEYAGKLADVSLETLTSTLGKLTKAQAEALDGTSETAKVFDALQISVKNTDGTLRSSTDVLKDFADRFQQLGGSPEAIAAGFNIFGRSFQEMIPLLKDGRAGIEAAGDELERFGGVISTEAGKNAEAFNDTLDALKTQFQSVFTQVAQQVLPTLVQLATDLKNSGAAADLASNLVSVLSGVLKAGVGVIDFYNGAVTRLSIAFQLANTAGEGFLEVQKNIRSLGLADGSVADGLNKISGAAKEAQGQLDKLAAKEKAGPNPFADVISNVSGADQGQTKQELQFAKDREEAQKRLAALFSQGTAARKERTKAVKEDTEAEKAYKENIEEVNKLIDDLAQNTQSDLTNKSLQRDEDQKQFLADLQFEAELLGKTAEEQEILNNLRYAGADANSEFGKSIIQVTQDMQAQREAINDQITVMDAFRNNFEDAFGDVLSGTKSLKDAFTDMVDSIIADLTRFIAQKLIEKAFGQTGSTDTGSAGGWIGAFASLFGGARATGGSVDPRKAYLVGENGPEMFVPTGFGSIKSAGQTQAGGVTVVQNISTQGRIDRRTASQIQQEAAQNLRIASVRNG